jgi:hypothetical protein
MSLEAMKLALAALELTPANETERYKQQLQARVALRQAIEQAEQAQPFCYHDGRNIVGKEFADHCDVFPLYTAPPQRKPLSDLAIADIYIKWDATPGASMADFARAIEAAHGIKEKNT